MLWCTLLSCFLHLSLSKPLFLYSVNRNIPSNHPIFRTITHYHTKTKYHQNLNLNQTGVMLLESIAPVVATIRSMETEDGVPLSYPYPAQKNQIENKDDDEQDIAGSIMDIDRNGDVGEREGQGQSESDSIKLIPLKNYSTSTYASNSNSNSSSGSGSGSGSGSRRYLSGGVAIADTVLDGSSSSGSSSSNSGSNSGCGSYSSSGGSSNKSANISGISPPKVWSKRTYGDRDRDQISRSPVDDSRSKNSSSSTYGSGNVQSKAAAAALKWKSAVLTSSTMSSKVRQTDTIIVKISSGYF